MYVLIGKRVDEHAISDAEDSCGGANAEREREHARNRETAIPAQLTKGIAKVWRRICIGVPLY